MKYKNMLHHYNVSMWDKPIYIFRSKLPKEHTKTHVHIIGFISDDLIKTINGSYNVKDFKKVRSATIADLRNQSLD